MPIDLNPSSVRRTAARLAALLLVAVLLLAAGLLLAPSRAHAQEPDPYVPDENTPPTAYQVGALPLPPMPPVETIADLVATTGPEAQQLTIASLEAASADAVTPRAFMPVVSQEYAPIQADRMGFGTAESLRNFSDIRSLYAGWYVNWGVSTKPYRPGGIEYMQMVRMHQDLVDGCKIGQTADRKLCPYKTPYSYTYSPSRAVIEAAARTNPGMTWLVGNEPDRVDGFGVNQDEMLPELYAFAYHELYSIIKAADPTARVAIAGVVQFTPLRKAYLDAVWAKYKQVYGVDMPVDVWNVHNFVGSEYCLRSKPSAERVCYAMAIPTGISVTPNSKGEERGAYVGQDWRHVYMPTFTQQIRDFRTWMKSKGQQNKPLIVTEYGVLYKQLCGDDNPATPNVNERLECIGYYGTNYVDLENPAVVRGFMINTFNYFTNQKDCSLSGVDGCRLVQRWAWYSLENAGYDFNPYTMLYDINTLTRTPTGDLYSQFSFDNVAALQYP